MRAGATEDHTKKHQVLGLWFSANRFGGTRDSMALRKVNIMKDLANYFAGCRSFRKNVGKTDDMVFDTLYSNRYEVARNLTGYYTVDTENHGAPVRDAAGQVMYRQDPGDAIEWVRAQNEWNDGH
jgi:hypothetical protein